MFIVSNFLVHRNIVNLMVTQPKVPNHAIVLQYISSELLHFWFVLEV